MRRAIVAALVLLTLSGCVGIPTSGGVEDGPVIDEQVDPEVVVLPSDPRAGSPPDEILTDFMQAVRGPQGNYAVARKYLTSSLAESWDPDAIAVIRTGPASLSAGEEGDPIGYTFTSRAFIDEQGRYGEQPDQAQQTLTFEFTQVRGEWRISAAPDGIVISQGSFADAFREQALYFFDPTHAYLVPDVRWFPARGTASVRVVQALLAGPTEWLAEGVLQTAFPTATVLGSGSVSIRSGEATVDLSTEALSSTAQERDRMRQQLVATLGVADAELTVGGRELPVPDPTAGAIRDPGVDGAALVGDGTAFGFDAGGGITPLAGLGEAIVASGATGATLSADKQVIAFRGADGGVYVASAGSVPRLLDSRGGLAAPALDPFRFVWSAQADSAASLTTFDLEGVEHPIQSGLAADSGIVSVDVSRDGTRLLLYLSSPAGPQLVVAGIVRQGNAPVRLGPLVYLPVGPTAPIDATWVSDRAVATLASGGQITAFELGGPSVELGESPGASTIVGGNNGVEGLRVLSEGQVWRPQGSSTWVTTGIAASFLATKQ